MASSGAGTPSRRAAAAAQVLRSVIVGLVTGLAVTMVGVYVYSFLARTNLRVSPQVPWAAPVALVLLWLYWRYLGGRGWPRRTAAYRERMRRARPLLGPRLPTTIAACAAGFAFVLAAMTFALRLAELPAGALRILPADAGLPLWTTVPLLLMLALVAGVCEEVGVRGYLQKAIEERGGPVLAIAVSALVFTLLHGNKAWFLQQAVPMFTAAVWYGYLTVATRSIYPMIVVHTLLDVVPFARYEVLGAPMPASIAAAGPSPAFWLNLTAAATFGVAAFALTARIRLPAGARAVGTAGHEPMPQSGQYIR